MFIKDCLKTKPIRFYCVEALYIFFLVGEFMITSLLLFIINCFYLVSKFIDLVSKIGLVHSFSCTR